jgi:hypothetical protein
MILAVLSPPEPLSAIETHEVLQHVRAGGALLYVIRGGSALEDSLHVRRVILGGMYKEAAAGTTDVGRPGEMRGTAPRLQADSSDVGSLPQDETASLECTHGDPNGGALPLWGDEHIYLYQLRFTRPRPPGMVTFARSVTDPQVRDSTRAHALPAAVGYPLGQGRLVIVSDPDLLRNDVLRGCRWGIDVVAVRMLEYLSETAGLGAGRRDRILFDEYHQGYGVHPGTVRAIVLYLARASSGHVLVQLLIGGLVLLLALGPRPLPPHDPEFIERRSPLEHVSALAQAYERVGATRTVTANLLRGVRRRVERKGAATAATTPEESDDAFLESVLKASPALAPQVALIRRALRDTVSRREFEDVGASLRQLEDSLLTLR